MVDSCKRPPPVRDHSVFAFWVVAYGRFDGTMMTSGGRLDDIHHFPLTLRMLHKGCYFHRLSDLVLAFSCGLAKIFQIYTLSVDTYFLGKGEKNSVFKNIRYRLLTVRVDRA